MPHDAISRALERRIPAGIRAPSLAVIRAIDLDYEALRGRQEVRDEAPEQWHLPAKEHAEPPPAEMVPHELLGAVSEPHIGRANETAKARLFGPELTGGRLRVSDLRSCLARGARWPATKSRRFRSLATRRCCWCHD